MSAQLIFFFFDGATGTVTTVPPEDPDDDISVTARTDINGATVRAARFVVSHAADGVRNADFTGFDRMATADRYRIRSSREMRTPNLGQHFEVQIESIRGGEAWAIDRIIAWVSPEQSRPRAADTTNRTDGNGATCRVPSMTLRVAADSESNADLKSNYQEVRDRWVARFAVPSQAGLGNRFIVELEEDGRAGNAWAIGRIVAWLSAEGESSKAAVT